MNTKPHTIYAIGYNHFYDLGFHHDKDIKELTKWTDKNNHISIKKINSGLRYNIITDQNGNIWSMGDNQWGSCGVQNKDQFIKVPEQMSYFKKNNIKIQQVVTSINSRSTFYVTTEGTIYANGYNEKYQLGSGDKTRKQSEPKRIECLTNIIKICPSWYYSVYVDDKGSVYSTPWSQYGGNGHKENNDNDGTWKKIKIFQNKKIIQIAAGFHHSIFVDSENMPWAVGRNGCGQCGIKTNLDETRIPVKIQFFINNKIKIREIKCGDSHNLSIDYDGNLFCWGHNERGQCGDGSTTHLFEPKRIEIMNKNKVMTINCGSYHSHFMTESKEHFLFGGNRYNECSLCSGFGDSIKIPLCINNMVKEKSNAMEIKSVCLGFNNTMILVCDSSEIEEKKDDFEDREKKLNEIELKLERLEKENKSLKRINDEKDLKIKSLKDNLLRMQDDNKKEIESIKMCHSNEIEIVLNKNKNLEKEKDFVNNENIDKLKEISVLQQNNDYLLKQIEDFKKKLSNLLKEREEREERDEKKNDDDNDNNNDIKKDLIDLKDKINKFSNIYNKDWIFKMFSNSSDSLIIIDSDINSLIFCLDSFNEYLLNLQCVIHSLLNADIFKYKEWKIDSMIQWISLIEGGRFKKYIQKLRDGFISDQINGEYLAELNRNDLRMPPFNISHFGDRRDLEQHFKSLKNKNKKVQSLNSI